MPMDMSRYPPDWKEISLRIRNRARWYCEWCGAEHGKPHPDTGKKVVLTVHHCGIDKPDGTPGDRNDKMDNREDNLAALCQPCHLAADRDLNVAKATRTKYERKHEIARAAGQKAMFEDD